MIV
ncbi:hypothetical protein LINPERPRIM_LOCUS27371 [Linum perenne]|jgi:hypothetical protein